MRLCALLWQKPGRKGPNAKGSKAPAQATQFLHHLHVLLLLPIVLYGALIKIQIIRVTKAHIPTVRL